MDEGDEATGTPAGDADNSATRLLALSDGVFAIAMTLLALDLKVPDAGHHPSDHYLRHLLAQNSSSYLSFAVSFYVIAGYWVRHRHLMRAVDRVDAPLVRDTILLLFVVAAMPFPASLLGQYGGTPISLALYGVANAVAVLLLMAISLDVRRQQVRADSTVDYVHDWNSWLNLAVFLACVPVAYLLPGHGVYVLVLLAIPRHARWYRWVARRVHA